MRQTQFKELMIFSAERGELTIRENRDRTRNLKQCLDDLNIAYSSGLGSYKGNLEMVILVVPRDINDIQAIMGLCFDNFDQDSILHRNKTGGVKIVTRDGATISSGAIKEVSKERAYANDYYTLFNDKYYVSGVV